MFWIKPVVPPAWACEGWSYRPTVQLTGASVPVMAWLPLTVSTSLSAIRLPALFEVSENVITLVLRPLIAPMLAAAASLELTDVPAPKRRLLEHSTRA